MGFFYGLYSLYNFMIDAALLKTIITVLILVIPVRLLGVAISTLVVTSWGWFPSPQREFNRSFIVIEVATLLLTFLFWSWHYISDSFNWQFILLHLSIIWIIYSGAFDTLKEIRKR